MYLLIHVGRHPQGVPEDVFQTKSLVRRNNSLVWRKNIQKGCFRYILRATITLVNENVCSPSHLLGCGKERNDHDDVINWKYFPRNWPFVRGIHRSPGNSTHKGQCRGALMFALICVWINDWVNNREAGDLRRNRAHYDVILMHEENNQNNDFFVVFRGIN